jgi:ubiquinone/menaquinone biosynthesis C-methylase UbiE
MDESPKSFDPLYFEPLFHLEDHHFWFKVRNLIIRSLVHKEVASLQSGYRLLEIGCGTGNVLRNLENECQNGVVIGMDLFHRGLLFAQKRVNCGLVQADLNQPPFSIPLDVIGLFDVLEHIQDDQAVLNRLFSLVGPGGKLIITVPAQQKLTSYFDMASRHVRRYDREELRAKLEHSGFKVDFISYYMMIIYPIVWLRRTIKNKKGLLAIDDPCVITQSMEELRIIPVINEILIVLLKLEAQWIKKGKTLPFGTSLVTVASKPI